MLGSQEKILEPKVNVKFFTVDPYTRCYKVSRPKFPTLGTIFRLSVPELQQFP